MPTKKPTNGNDTIVGTKAAEVLHGLGGDDDIHGSGGNDRLYGDEGNDRLYGDDGNDFAFGGAGNDVASGGTGNDDLRGEDGNDTLAADSGNDAVNGGAGADILTGGTGADHFDYLSLSDSVGGSVDRITDYSLAAGDDLVFAALDANAGMPGWQQWVYVAEPGAFPGDGSGQATLTYDASSNTTTLNLYNNDSDSTADFTVIFDGNLGAGDILINVLGTGGDPIPGIIW